MVNFLTKIKQHKLFPYGRSLIFMLIGAFLCAVGIDMFYLPFKFTMGGLSGIAAIIYYLTGDAVPFGTLTFILNLPLLLLGLKFVNLKFVIKSLIGIFFFSGVIDLLAGTIDHWFQSIYRPINGQLPDLFIFAVIGGIIFGIGLGLFFLAGYTTGGTDILAVIINRIFPFISIGRAILLIDIVIVSATLIIPPVPGAPSPFLLAMYSFVSLYISTKAIDICISGWNFSRSAFIISDHAQPIAEAILSKLERGVTGFTGQGMFTNNGKTILFCVLPNRQIKPLRDIVAAIDPGAFIVVEEAREVYGQGFTGNNEELF